MDEDLLFNIESQRFYDATRQVKAIKSKQANISNIPKYIDRDNVSGFRKVETQKGIIFTRYRSNAQLKTDQVIPVVNQSNFQIGSIDTKPS
jgi:hypothetical protein